MKKSLVILGIIAVLSFNCAFATEVACVDVQKVVNSSKQVQDLKKAQEAKAKEFVKFVENARKEIAAVSDVKKKQSLEEKYNKELISKKEKSDKEYNAKLKSIESSISNVIAQEAKNKGYDMVVTKGTVLYSNNDITQDIISAIAAAEKAQNKTTTQTTQKNTKKKK
ncbi:OmpH family outer membrane protein [bacterium]|nr:OmpH family outer membrane protein [bacterium]